MRLATPDDRMKLIKDSYFAKKKERGEQSLKLEDKREKT